MAGFRLGCTITGAGLGKSCGLHPGHVDPRVRSGRFKTFPLRPDRIPKRPCIDVRPMMTGKIPLLPGVGKIPGGVNGSLVFKSATRALICATLS